MHIIQCGNTAETFRRDRSDPLVEPSMGVYSELKRDMFGTGRRAYTAVERESRDRNTASGTGE